MPPRARPDVFEALHDLMHAYRARMVRADDLRAPDLTFNEVRALNFIGRHPGATQKNWCATAAPTRPGGAHAACCRTRAGWSANPHAEDRRSLCLTLSAEGQALYQALQAAWQTLSAQVLAGCDDDTQAQLLALLARGAGQPGCAAALETGEDCGHGGASPPGRAPQALPTLFQGIFAPKR